MMLKRKPVVAILTVILLVSVFSSLVYLNQPRILSLDVSPTTVREGEQVYITLMVEGFISSVSAWVLSPNGSRTSISLSRVGELYHGTWTATRPFERYQVGVEVNGLAMRITQTNYVKVVEDSGSQIIAVLLDVEDQVSSWRESKDFFPIYIREVLHHAGLPYETVDKSALSSTLQHRILILPYNVSLTNQEREKIAEFVALGGVLIGIGGASGLNEIFGVHGPEKAIDEGYIRITNKTHPITSNLTSSLHILGTIPLYSTAGGRSLAQVRGSLGEDLNYPAIMLNRYLDGLAILITPDLLSSIVKIQQGRPVTEDGPWPVNDGILKTDDSTLLNYTTDRETVSGHEVFLQPVADEEREIILKSILYAAWDRGILLPMLWYWPGETMAVALYSHDSDGGDEVKARFLLSNMSALEVKSTWCVLYGEGYSSEFYGLLKEYGYEIALHYDALPPRRSWSKSGFLTQYDAVASETGITLVSNKNHYLRWEQWTEFYRWCEEKGIELDQTKGPSKVHNFGFLFGTSHLYFPMDDWSHRNRFLNVLEVTLHDQEMWREWPESDVEAVLNGFAYHAYKHYGVAHHLFHPAHIQLTYKILNATVQFIRELPCMKIWTSQQINEWERGRRELSFQSLNLAGHSLSFYLSSLQGLENATIMILLPRGLESMGKWFLKLNDEKTNWDTIQAYGFSFLKFTKSIKGKVAVEVQFQMEL